MMKHLWDVSGGKPQFAQVTGITGGTGVTTLLADSAVPATKRVVPVWMVIWVPGASSNSLSDIGLRSKGTGNNIFFNGAGGNDNYHNLLKQTLFLNFGSSFINRATLGVGLEVMHDIDTSVENASVIVGYYII